ncbi:AraC family transcriptional regulator [Acerihabitans arboris]|uniref:Helix-turn-helix domain-containing protein n=1 Tax=Acerihabitans arboris TaxID=2691583 RepID=A0A845STG9_9GAMM|nr:AraC family transcriptional regulator [Acerihabitans arboris]NDL66038.1 helix-turn-helix domain-containing protein [Acerihabitans arboris]
MKHHVHNVKRHHPLVPGLEAMSLLTEHAFPRHSHDQFGIGIFIQGAQHSWSNIGKVESSAGDIIMVNPGEIHDGIPLQGPRGWHMIYINPEVVAQELRDLSKVDDFVMRPVVSDQELRFHMRNLFTEINTICPDRTAVEEAFLLCLMRVTHYHIFSKQQGKTYSPAIALAKQYLDDSPEEKVTLSMLSSLCGVSRFQLIRGFSRETGVTPHAYLVQSRVRLARRLLLEGKKITDTALVAGFADQSHLTRAFQKQFGITPGHYVASAK